MLRIVRWMDENRKISWFLTGSYMLIIFILSSMPDPPQPVQPDIYVSTVEHVLEYTVLGFLLAISLGAGRKMLTVAVFFACVYAVSDEFHQSFVPGRDASFLDVAADCLGALLGVWARKSVDELKPKRLRVV